MQEPGDIRYFMNATQRFNVRAAVLLENAGRLLVTPEADQPGMFKLPGGAVKFGESAIAAAVREVQEELQLTGLDFEPAGTVEAFFTLAGVDYHQIILISRALLTAKQATRVVNFHLDEVDLAPDTKLVW